METISHNFYGYIQIFSHDDAICIWLKKGYIWEQVLQRDFGNYYKGGDILDIGAYIGLHTIAMSKIVKEGSVVHAFECQPKSYELLRLNTKKRGNVITYNNIISSSKTQRYIKTFDENVDGNYGGMGSYSEKDESHMEMNIPTMSIDDLKLSDIGLIKIDVEGHELDVLKGAEQTIKKYKPPIFIEILGGVVREKMTSEQKKHLDDVLQYLHQLGYKFEKKPTVHDYIFI